MEKRKQVSPGMYLYAPESERLPPEWYFEALAPFVAGLAKELARPRADVARVGRIAACWEEVPLDGVELPFLTIDGLPGIWYLAPDAAYEPARRSKRWRHEITGTRLAAGTNQRFEWRLGRRRAG